MLAAPVATWIALAPAPPAPVADSFQQPLSSAGSAALRAVPTSPLTAPAPSLPSPFFSWVVAVWVAGAIAFWLRLCGGWIVAGRLRSRSVRPASGDWQHALDSLKARLSVTRPVRLLVSSLIDAPAVVGWLRPVVLVPAGALAGFPSRQMEALLLHELAHIRRHDYLVNLAQSVIEALLFYHPAVWWISGHIRAERELCCDDLAVSVTGDAVAYVRALVEVAAAPARLRAAMAAGGGSLSHRVARLLGHPRPAPRSDSGAAILTVAALLTLTGLALFGQAQVRPQFGAASVKPAVSRGFQMVRPAPGRLTASASLPLLLQNAYGVQQFQIVGMPDWVGSARFEIEAKAAGTATRPEIFLMLQSLLEERFQLRVHREKREMPVYALVAARSGLRLPPPKEGSCVKPAPDAEPGWAGGRIAPPGDGSLPLPPCGSVVVRLDPSGARLDGGSVGMPELVRVLSMVMGRSVVDRTGSRGVFDVKLGFLPDQATAALPPPPPDAPPELPYPSIVTSLQEQLGLRVESARGPVEVLVVDRVERPSAN